MKVTDKPVLFSGIQPSGNLTLGNYIGALKNWIKLQETYNCFFSLVDLHTITVRQDPKEFYQQCYDALAIYLAFGLDPEKNTIFLQSHVTAHSQLAWILNCYAYVGELSRMTQFKDKSAKNKDNNNVGLFTYPVLMAADILLYQTSLVPVGADQKQHVEIARDIAIRFNNIYGDIFKVPEIYHPTVGARIMSLQDPTNKMSKSDKDSGATIFLLDTPDTIIKKIKRAVTDSGSEVVFDKENKPGISNLLTIMSAVSERSIDDIVSEMEGQGYGNFKSVVADSVVSFLEPMQKRYKELRGDQEYLNSILKNCSEKAAKYAEPTLKKVYEVLGFVL